MTEGAACSRIIGATEDVALWVCFYLRAGGELVYGEVAVLYAEAVAEGASGSG